MKVISAPPGQTKLSLVQSKRSNIKRLIELYSLILNDAECFTDNVKEDIRVTFNKLCRLDTIFFELEIDETQALNIKDTEKRLYYKNLKNCPHCGCKESQSN